MGAHDRLWRAPFSLAQTNGSNLSSALPSTFHFKHAADFRVAVAGSVLVHFAALVFLSQVPHQIQHLPPDTVLTVELVPAQPLPVAPAIIEPPHPHHMSAPRAPQPHLTASEPPKLQIDRPAAPALNAISEPRSVVEPAPSLETAPLAQPETKTGAVAAPRDIAVATPPSFSATYLNNPRPNYPRLARRNGEEGTVILRVLVTRQGVPSRVDMDKSSGSTTLDTAALEAVKGWRFVPARKGNELLEDWVRVPIVFRLQDPS